MKNNKRISKWLLPFFMLVILCGNALAVPPQAISYQAYLKDNAGLPVNATENVTFRIYNVDVGGVALWTDVQSVTITDGLFSVELGGAGNPLPKASMDAPLWLGVEVNTDGEASPRKALASVNNAFRAEDSDTLEGLSAASLDQSAHLLDTANPHGVTAAQVGAASATDITGGIATHTADSAAHHTKTDNFTELSGQAADAQIPALIARDTEITWSNLAGKPAGFADGIDNDSGGDITAVGVSTGLTGGGTVGDVLISVAVPLTLSASSVNPIISGTNNGSAGSSGVKGANVYTTSGYLGVQGSSAFDGAIGLDINGNEIGVLGLSVGTSVPDNYGLYGYSNNIGIYAEGGTQAGVFVGDVVIGTGTGGSEKLVVQGDGTSWSEGFLAIKNIAEDAGIRIYDGDATPRFHIFNDNSGADELRIAPQDTYTSGGITIEQNGEVGIGETAPNAILHIDTTGVETPFRVQKVGATKLLVASTGAVAIGGNVTNPASRLQITGGNDASLGTTIDDGYMVVGSLTGLNVVFDDNEIMARNNGVKSKLFLNKDSSYVVVPGLEITGGADLVEPFDVASDDLDGIVVPGMVVSINPEQPGKLKVAQGAYDRTVAGIISGANGINPGLSMAQQGSIADGSHPVALTGRLYALADASYGAIEPGDMLTTSDTLGHVMKVTDHNRAQGAIIGKAMTSLDSGKGHVLVLVTLQ